jgi:hypothetical protein
MRVSEYWVESCRNDKYNVGRHGEVLIVLSKGELSDRM